MPASFSALHHQSMPLPARRARSKRRAAAATTPALFCIALALLGRVPAASAQNPHDFNTDNVTTLTGTWSSGSGGVTTGESFCNPVNYTFNVPTTTGISFSFTDDGYFEESRYQFNANGSEPHCIQAYLLWQHGNYTFQPNGSITMSPIAADGRIQVQDPCAYTTTIMTYYYEPGLYQHWTITNDVDHNQYKLQMYQFDGAPLAPMYLQYNPPQMWPVGIQLTTNSTIKEYQAANGAFSGATSVRPSLIGLFGTTLTAGVASLAYFLLR